MWIEIQISVAASDPSLRMQESFMYIEHLDNIPLDANNSVGSLQISRPLRLVLASGTGRSVHPKMALSRCGSTYYTPTKLSVLPIPPRYRASMPPPSESSGNSANPETTDSQPVPGRADYCARPREAETARPLGGQDLQTAL
ncbi:hypothetical protein JX265_005396 [Neoarthrinium moseri]|uniref:Uncharacterized protein n=1 Tax=Neoarthrinium moseri TaxID=1658444 RepID=A0A9P9WNI4_9PEZI|nr:uncharacterized protein JN550_009383 [Neoarthrinium moseri]KAI1845241.1 hypothetical protein JX266_008551 [Neoarthrinium moseri]KAI1863885.1 hypothetical protein JN550_009383 [Neoarthrinium moseri]KAI1872516.1 hypothetical protein JX265_005396 [Neoarthrinium moseri]